MKRKTLIIVAFSQVVLTLAIVTAAYAQPIPPTPQSPLGSGFLMLLGAGIVYGFSRFFKSKNK